MTNMHVSLEELSNVHIEGLDTERLKNALQEIKLQVPPRIFEGFMDSLKIRFCVDCQRAEWSISSSAGSKFFRFPPWHDDAWTTNIRTTWRSHSAQRIRKEAPAVNVLEIKTRVTNVWPTAEYRCGNCNLAKIDTIVAVVGDFSKVDYNSFLRSLYGTICWLERPSLEKISIYNALCLKLRSQTVKHPKGMALIAKCLERLEKWRIALQS